MQPNIQKSDLEKLGLLEGLDSETVEALLTHANTTLEERVAAEMMSLLDDDEAGQLIDMQEDEAPASTIADWISERIPNASEILDYERDILLGELVENADSIAS